MKCYYHKDDLDGLCSFAIIQYKYPDVVGIGVSYGDTVDTTQLVDGEIVFVVDFSFKKDEMIRLAQQCELIWIDHHKTAIDDFKDYSFEGLQVIGKSGCELTWEYIFSFMPMPLIVKLIGRYDVWDHSDERTVPFQYACTAVERKDSLFWKLHFEDERPTMALVRSGFDIVEYVRMKTKSVLESARYVKFGNYDVLIANIDAHIIAFYEELFPVSLYIFWKRKGNGKYYVSLRSRNPEIDAGLLAKRFGGGGHKGAAGFEIDEQSLNDLYTYDKFPSDPFCKGI